jgi:hypothetical protein
MDIGCGPHRHRNADADQFNPVAAGHINSRSNNNIAPVEVTVSIAFAAEAKYAVHVAAHRIVCATLLHAVVSWRCTVYGQLQAEANADQLGKLILFEPEPQNIFCQGTDILYADTSPRHHHDKPWVRIQSREGRRRLLAGSAEALRLRLRCASATTTGPAAAEA